MAEGRQRLASALVFCPQNRPPKVDYLKRLRHELATNPALAPFVQAILDLPKTWDLYAWTNSDIAALKQGPQHIRQLRDWIVENNAAPLAETMSGILLLPLLTIIHITQYFQYLASMEIQHSEFLEDIRVGGAHGLCGGMLAATAIAASSNESEVVQNACTSLRLALCIGACGELGDDPLNLGASTVVLRIQRIGYADEIVAKFPRTYVATVADPYSISVVGPVQVLAELKAYAESEGIPTTELHLRGKVHNPENEDLCEELCNLCSRHPELQLPTAETLRVPVRSNKTGEVLRTVPLSREVLEGALVRRCEWYHIVTALAEDLSKTGESAHKVVMFGTGRKNCLASEQFERRGLTVEKIDVVAHVDAVRPRYSENAIAVVGASCRLPGANSLDEFWELIAEGHDRHDELPSDRFDLYGGHRASLCQEYAKGRKFYANLLEQVDTFDHKFFGMSAREAINTDPQQRILLELAYQAMESSGYMRTHDRARSDNVGCFIGASFVEYLDNTNANPPTAYTSTGTIRAFLCGRLSYYFGWSGPAEVIDTACSSSLVAINRAVRAIQSGECNSALCGGINVITGQNNFLDLGRAGFLSPTGQCKPFDQNADGYCRAEGGGLVFLKKISAAQRDGDHIMAVIPGSGTNQGGLSKALTIPDSTALSTLYRSVLTQASLSPDAVTYVEAHGTGTQAGDPVEVASIRNVFGNAHRQEKLNLASVKGNIGHCETAAGVAGLLKVICMLDKGKVPPQANHSIWNPKIPPLQPDGMRVSKSLEPWNVSFRAALVNSYGAAGSNAALLCCEPPSITRPAPIEALQSTSLPILISAESESSLKSYQGMLARHLERTTQPPSIFEISYTLAQHRRRQRHSTIIEASSTQELIAALKDDGHQIFERSKTPESVVLLLGGQHKRSIGLAKQLYNRYPYFRARLDECDTIIQELGSSILPAVFESTDIDDVVVLQAGLVAVEYALAMSWIQAGMNVSAIVGHSLGELAGLAVSGMLTLRDCLKLVVTRASLIQRRWGVDKGAMLAVSVSREGAQELLTGLSLPLDVACYNSPNGQVVAGETAAIAALEVDLRARVPPIKFTRVDTSHAFHSRLADPILQELDEVSSGLDWRAPTLPIRLCSEEAQPMSLPYSPSTHARGPVFLERTLKRVEAEFGKSTWIEVGVNSPIVAMAQRALETKSDHCFYPMVMTNESASAHIDVISRTVSELWRKSIDVSHWAYLHTSSAASAVWLPPYQFDDTTMWLDNMDHAAKLQSQLEVTAAATPKVADPIPVKRELVVPISDAVGQSSRRKRFQVSPQSERFRTIVSGHAVRNQPLCPASVYLECVTMAISKLSPLDPEMRLEFANLDLQAPLGLSCEEIEVNIEAHPTREKTWDFTMSSTSPQRPGKRNMHGQGTVSLTSRSDLAVMERLVQRRIQDFKARGTAEKLRSRRAYDMFSRVVNYKDFLKGITSISIDDSEAIAKIDLPGNQPAQEESSAISVCEAVVMDNFIQVVGLLMNTSDLVASSEVMVCTGIEYGTTSDKFNLAEQRTWTVHAAYSPLGSAKAAGDVFVFAEDGIIAAAFTGCQFTKLKISQLERALGSVNENCSSQVTKVAPMQQALSRRPQVPRLESMPPLSSDSDSTSSVDSGPPSPGPAGEDVLLNMLERLTGAAPSAVSQDKLLSDLGVDSLAAIDFATQLTNSFQVTIDGGDLLGMTVGELGDSLRLRPSKTPVQSHTEQISSVVPVEVIDIDQETDQSSTNAIVFELLAEAAGCVASAIKPPMTLDDLGIDSLALIEVCTALSRVAKRSIEPDDVTSDMTVAQILQMLPTQTGNKVVTATVQQTTTTVARKDACDAGTLPSIIASRAQAGAQASVTFDMSFALKTCEMASQIAAEESGFRDYWLAVGPQQDRLTIVYLLEALLKLGINLANLQPGALVPEIPHLPRYTKLGRRIWHMLAEYDIVKKGADGRYVASGGASTFAKDSSIDLHNAFVQQYPQYAGEANLMQLTGPRLAECLTGDCDAVKLLFGSEASNKVLADYYGKSPMLACMTSQLATLVTALLDSARGQTSEPFRILEVGAGTGGTTGLVVDMFRSRGFKVEYTFTDISATLVSKAKRRFSQHSDWMSFERVDLERPVAAHLKGKFNIVFATNCVHATKDRVGTCSRIRDMLTSDGFMILSEVTRIINWYDIVFGLLDGWWLSEGLDAYPLQPPEDWMSEFRKAGFASTAFTRGPTEDLNTQRLLIGSNSQVGALDAR